DVISTDVQLSTQELDFLGREVFVDPIVQAYCAFPGDLPLPVALTSAFGASDFSVAIEVGFLPGVTDNVGRTACEAMEDALKRPLGGQAYSCIQYLVWGPISIQQARKIGEKLLANTLIERVSVLSHEEFVAKKGFAPHIPKVVLKHTPQVREIPFDRPMGELLKMSDEMCLSLSQQELVEIKKYYASEKVLKERIESGLPAWPTDAELECIAQTWSEHCKHKIFNAKIRYEQPDGSVKNINSLFKTYVKRATEKLMGKRKDLVSVFTDNAGIVRFDQNNNVAVKVETHNSPSALDPYGGALTGIVGVNRDVLGAGMGAQFIFNTNVFCFASPFYSGEIPSRLMHPKRIFEGVRKGVEHGGNTTGIPTVNGCLVFDNRYLGKPLVYCGTGGIMPSQINGSPSHLKCCSPGDAAIMVGGRVGKDGIHGATFSSVELNESSPATAVQIGDPITQRKMYDMLLVARDKGLYGAITDNGAGGLSSSIGEMCQLSGGAEIYLDKVPLKYPGLDPWEILISESQERMTVSVAREKAPQFLALAKEMRVEATIVGTFTSSGKFIAKYGDKVACCLEMAFLHEGVPQMKLHAKLDTTKSQANNQTSQASQTAPIQPSQHAGHISITQDIPIPQDISGVLKSVLGRLNVCSKEYVVRQYDHEVQGTSIIKPLAGADNDGPSDASAITPVLGSQKGLVVSNGICPRYSDLDAYSMSACAFDEAVRNAVATGADPKTICALDNFCWPDPVKSAKTPDGAHKLAQLVEANRALYDYSIALKIPLISGKDSMKNDYKMGDVKISVPPTILYSAVGTMEDAAKAVTIDAKNPGDFIYIIGMTKEELGASEYFAQLSEAANDQNIALRGIAPRPDLSLAPAIYKKLHRAMSSRLVASCHDCSDGGLAVALSETLFAGGFGGTIDLRQVPSQGRQQGSKITRDDFVLFSESASRFVATVKPKHAARFEKKLAGVPFAKIGEVTAQPMLEVTGLAGQQAINEHIGSLKAAWKKTLDW
ncbi:phosphoribosylformylglycinamidine synthase, partial [Candidatus Parvarchaeota archaeon]|nr:phosphoribosylformylglycinamidine synthase [Candidatus Parvarchaeota archaeon]